MARDKKCRICKKTFRPFNTLQAVCGVTCALEDAKRKQEKEDRKRLQEFRVKNRTLADWHRLTQPKFNKFIRLRDHGQPCISCGRYDHEIEYRGVGGKWDCGHYLTIGAHVELRYTELNAHRQCKSCNGGSGRFTRKNKTVAMEYRDRLIERIGLEKVEWLEGPHPPRHWTKDEIQEIGKKYAAKARDLEKQLGDKI